MLNETISERLRAVDDPVALLEGLFANAPMGLEIYDADGHTVVVNEAFIALFGSAPPPDYCVFKDEIAARTGLLDLVKRAFAGETVFVPAFWYDPRELEHVTVKEGRRVAIEITAFPLRDREGRVAHVAFVFDDVTRDLTAKEEREAVTAQLQLILDRMPVGCMLNDAEFRFTYWNPAAERIFGYRFEEVKGKHPFETITPPAAQPLVSDIFARLAAGEQLADAVGDNLTKDGRLIRCEWQNTVLREADGKFTGIMSMCRDVTEEMARRAEREALTRRLQLLLDRMPIGCLVSDAEFKFTYWNPAAERIFGFSFAEVEGKDAVDTIVPPEALGLVRDIFGRLKHGTPSAESINENITKDGRRIMCRWHNNAIRDGEGRFIGTLTLCEDITEQMRRDAQLAQAQKMEAVGQLTGGVAHDFNNLLTVVIGNLEMAALDTAPGAPAGPMIDTAMRAAERGAELVQRLLAFARRQVLQPKVIGLNELIGGLLPLLKRSLGEDIGIETVFAADIWPTLVDRGQVENALINLAINARDAMPSGGKLTIETANADLDADYATRNADVMPGQYAMLAVTDTGTGMTPDVLSRAMEPFFTTKEPGKGSGLGLAMIYGFVKQSDGHMKIYSEVGHGTTVRMYLPRADGGAVAEALPRAEPALPRGRETVLVVEDDEEVRRLAVGQLVELGYRVLEASSGPAAEPILRSDEPVDLLFTDVVMPGGMTGRDLAEQARRLRPNIRVLYTTGYTENAIVHQGKLDRGVQLLSKPYRKRDLARLVRTVLDSPPDS
jgi:two-component system, cell cycle sensor histidine kinase and response regulator CckA